MKRILLRFWVAAPVAALLALGACGDGGSGDDAGPIMLFDAGPADASRPDALVCDMTVCNGQCIDTTTNHDFCGDCNTACTSAAACDDSECTCPAPFIPNPFETTEETFGGNSPPSVFARATFTGTDSLVHRLSMRYDYSTIPIDTPIDLSAQDGPSVSLRYDTEGELTGRFSALEGTLVVTRACADGIAGTLTSVVFAEAVQGIEVTDGCSEAVASTSFDLGSDCVPLPDGGVLDAGMFDAAPSM